MFPNLRVRPGALAVLLLLLILPCASAFAAAPERVRKLLVLYAYEKDLPANLIMDESLRAAFKANGDERIEVFSEYMDLGRFADGLYDHQLAEHYRQKYSRHKIDLIITVVAPALDFVLKHRGQLFPGIPIVFCVVLMVADEASLHEAITKMTPVVVVVDLSLPVNGSCNIMRQLSSRYPGLKIIVLSVHDEPAAVQASLAAGVAGFVLKRTAATDLVEAVKEVLEGRGYISPDVRPRST